MNKVKITYEYCGLKAIPKKRIKELSSIVFNSGGKKYRNIKLG